MLRFTTKSAPVRVLALGGLCAVLLSFSTLFGGEGFEIFLNNKVVMQRFGENMDKAKTLVLEGPAADAQITVKYHHCGKVGTNRNITIKDGNNKILKEWRFNDIASLTSGGGMDFRVKDIITLQKSNTTATLNLYYSSNELPKGRLLTSLVISPAKSKVAVR